MVSGLPRAERRRQWSAHRLRAVEGLPDDVGVAGVLGRLGDQVQQNPADGPTGTGLEPSGLGQGLRGVQGRQRGDQVVGAASNFLVVVEQARQRLTLQHAKGVCVRFHRLFAAKAHGLRSPDDEACPAPLGPGHVLYQATQAELTDGGPPARLLVGEIPDGMAQRRTGGWTASPTSRPARVHRLFVRSSWVLTVASDSGPGAQLAPTKAACHVVHDQTGRLEMRVADDRPDKRESPPPQVRAHLFREQGLGRDLRIVVPGVDYRHATDKAPDVVVEGAELAPNVQERPGIGDRALHLAAVADDAGIREKSPDVGRLEPGDGIRVEVAEGLPVAVPALQDRDPAQAGLRGLEDQELEVPAIVVHWYAPLLVVIGPQERTGRPSTSVRLRRRPRRQGFTLCIAEL